MLNKALRAGASPPPAPRPPTPSDKQLWSMPNCDSSGVQAVKQVFEQRTMYDAVVAGDYMRHAQLIAALQAWAQRFGQPLRIVDLGCGDASLAASSFAGATVERYVGIDLAESSIEQARVSTAAWQGRVELICGNLFDALHGMVAESANVVLASYSLHHFSTVDKGRLLGEISRVLEPRGALLWIDVVRDEGQSRDECVNGLAADIRRHWTLLSVEERERAAEHVLTSDFPETEGWMMEATAAAGFSAESALLKGELFRGWALTRD
jgi:ubiquinone/menaquinone biosynthesis C-methylase UbiE